jgi:hypothetical protein
MQLTDDLLPFERIVRKRDEHGRVLSEEYLIPDDMREETLRAFYIFDNPPSLDKELIDIHVDRPFVVRDYKLVREGHANLLVSPYYYEAGGTVIDWWDEDDDRIEAIDDAELTPELFALIERDVAVIKAHWDDEAQIARQPNLRQLIESDIARIRMYRRDAAEPGLDPAVKAEIEFDIKMIRDIWTPYEDLDPETKAEIDHDIAEMKAMADRQA